VGGRRFRLVKTKAPILALSLVLGSLGGCGDRPPAGPSGTAVEVRAEGVTLRQYRAGELRLEARAERLRLDERAGSLEIEGGVRGEIAPALIEAAPAEGPAP